MDTEVPDGVWMSAARPTVELFVPRLFADAPIVLHAPDHRVCRPRSWCRALPAGAAPRPRRGRGHRLPPRAR